MRINVYSQELTSEVIKLEKESNTGIVYTAAQLVLHSSPMLHHPPQDDDRSAVTFWLPSSPARRAEMAGAFSRIAAIFRGAASAEDTLARAEAAEAEVLNLKARLAEAERARDAYKMAFHKAQATRP